MEFRSARVLKMGLSGWQLKRLAFWRFLKMAKQLRSCSKCRKLATQRSHFGGFQRQLKDLLECFGVFWTFSNQDICQVNQVVHCLESLKELGLSSNAANPLPPATPAAYVCFKQRKTKRPSVPPQDEGSPHLFKVL